jgi:hypothetical protein
MNALMDSQMMLTEAQLSTDRRLVKTDERLGSLIDAVDRLVRNGRNGKSPVKKSAKKPRSGKVNKR